MIVEGMKVMIGVFFPTFSPLLFPTEEFNLSKKKKMTLIS